MRSMSLGHIRSLISRRLLGDASLEDICDERIVVSEAEAYENAPSIFLPHQLENITAIHPYTSQEVQDMRVYGGKGVHAATEAFRISGVRYSHGVFYKRNWRHYLPHIPPTAAPSAISGGSYALTSSHCGRFAFGHWVRDDVTTNLLADGFAELISTRGPHWPHAEGYQKLLGVSSRIVDKGDMDELFVFRDIGQNSHKAARYRELRRRLRESIKPERQGHKVYLKRGSGGVKKRILSNEEELTRALADQGYVILDLTKDPLEFMMQTMLDMRLFISIEGSNINHALYSIGDGGGVLAISPPNMFNNAHKDWTSVLGMKYALAVGESDGAAFKVNVPELLTIADKLEAAL